MNLQDIWQTLPKKTDKNSVHSYLPVYDEILLPYKGGSILEIGLFNGDSILLWEQYFKTVHGVDCSETPHDGMADLRPMIAEGKNIHILDATDSAQVKEKFEEMKFDVIVDDAAHNMEQQILLYDIWKEYLNPNGIYIIEDIQEIDSDRIFFENLGGEIIDLRNVKNRYDDVLVVFKNNFL